MKRFLVFAGNELHPKGGMLDFKGSFDTVEEADDYAQKLLHTTVDILQNYKSKSWMKIDWAQVYDMVEHKIIWKDWRL